MPLQDPRDVGYANHGAPFVGNDSRPVLQHGQLRVLYSAAQPRGNIAAARLRRTGEPHLSNQRAPRARVAVRYGRAIAHE